MLIFKKNNKVEKYISIIHTNVNSKEAEKDRHFLEEYIEEYEKELSEYDIKDMETKYGKSAFYLEVLKLLKDKYDIETIIVKYVNSISHELANDTFISNNYDYFMNLLSVDRENVKKTPKSEPRKISYEELVKLTVEFLMEIDDTNQLSSLFAYVCHNNKINMINNKKSKCEPHKIDFYFDGTLETAKDLIHEFMHYYIFAKSELKTDRERYSMFNELIPIYYEKAFMNFLVNKKIITKEECDTVVSRRSNKEAAKDPKSVVDLLCELARDPKNLSLEKIEKLAKERNIELLDITEFITNHYFSTEIVYGPILYRLANAIAEATPLDDDHLYGMYKLAPKVIDKQNDQDFFESYQNIKVAEENKKNTTK